MAIIVSVRHNGEKILERCDAEVLQGELESDAAQRVTAICERLHNAQTGEFAWAIYKRGKVTSKPDKSSGNWEAHK